MYDTERICPQCNLKILEELYPWAGVNSPCSVKGKSAICVSCLGKAVDRHNLNTVDKICQCLDVPFDPNLWIRLEGKEENVNKLILQYVENIKQGQYKEDSWFFVNKMWEKIRKHENLVGEIDEIKPDLLLFLKKKWGNVEGFSLEEYLKLEEYERQTLNHYNFKDEARRDMVRKLAKLSVLSDDALNKRDDKKASALLQSYNTLMKESGIRTEQNKDENTIESLSELVAYLEKTGFLLNYKIKENRDVVDKTLENMQQYVKRLFTDSHQEVTEIFANASVASRGGSLVTDDDFEGICETLEERTEVELEEALDEESLQKMLNEVEKEYE
jgi:hypothetical protein